MPGISCPATRSIFPGQGSNPCPLHRQVDSYPLDPQASPARWVTAELGLMNFSLCSQQFGSGWDFAGGTPSLLPHS